MLSIRFPVIALIVLLTLVVVACAPAPATAPLSTSLPASTATRTSASASTPDATPTVAPTMAATASLEEEANACPTPGADTALYTSEENGFCFLYPASMTAAPDPQRPGDVVILSGKTLPPPPKAMESVSVHLLVSANGPANGLDSAGYARQWGEYFAPGIELAPQEATIDGQAAQISENIPGFFTGRSAFIVANDGKYQITLYPRPQDVAELEADAAAAWDTVTQSIDFFTPEDERQVVGPEDVCPQETGEARLYVNVLDGYCLLYPADFAMDPSLPGVITGGPELGPAEGFDSVRTSLGIGTYYLGEQEPDQALTPISEQIDRDSVQPATIAGQQAVIYDFTGGPWRQRTAQILVDDSVYTLVGQPWDAEQFPQALAETERLWDTVTGSIAFFDKWH